MFDVKWVAIFKWCKFGKGLDDQVGYRVFEMPGHKKISTKRDATQYYRTVIDGACELLLIIPFSEWLGDWTGEK